MSLGMMSVLLIGGIDISVGATLAFSGMCASLLMRDGVYTSTFLMFLVSTVIGTCCGSLVGLVIAKGKVQPIIATLGFSNIFRGATYIVSGGAWVSAYQFQRPFKKFAQQSTLTFGAINNMVFIVNYNGIRIMVTGDLLEEDEHEILKHYRPEQLRCDILKVAHHGSKSSSSETFLDAASPSIAVIQCGRNNIYGHPHQQTLERLEERGIKVYRTDLNGAVGIDLDGAGISIDSFK